LAGSGDPIEFQQAGFEWFGGAGPEEDAEAAALTLDAAEKGGVRAAEPRFGDVAIFSAVLQALPMSEGWRERLRRAFSRRQGLEGMLANVERRTEEPGDALAEGLAQLPDALASRMIEDVFALAGVRPVGGRSAQEIALRLKARREEGTLDPGAVRAVLAYLDLSSPAEHAVAAIRGFASAHGLNPASLPLEAFEARLARLNALAPPFWKTARFFAATGRRFEYYDGFVFDLVRPDLPDLPIAAGGRYDGLVARLSQGRRQITAIGASIRLDRLSVAGGGA
jgi:ATP phosphoribosyltransferase regulatory subunit